MAMRAGKLATWTAPAILPLAVLCVPKCPLCFLALFAVAGSVLPPAPVLDGLVALAAFCWLALLMGLTRSAPARAIGVCGAILLLGGRWLGVAAACWAGAIVMVAVVARMRLRSRERARESAPVPMIPCADLPAARRL